MKAITPSQRSMLLVSSDKLGEESLLARESKDGNVGERAYGSVNQVDHC